MYHLHSPKGWDHRSRVMSYSMEVLRKDATFVPEVRSPTVRRRELGALLRALRLEKGLTVEQAAERLMFSMSKLSRMETGHGAATPRDIRDLCDLYDVTDEAERDRLMALAREGKQTGWWQSYDLDYFATYVGLEAAAVGIRYYQSAIVPGLMQTPDYARAMHEAGVPEFTPERINELVEVRLRRQRLLVQDPPVRLEVVLDEAVLHRLVGWIYVERPQDIRRYQEIFEHLCTIALSPKESIKLMTGVARNIRAMQPLAAAEDAWT